MRAEKSESLFELSYTVACEIHAPPSRVWALLTDAAGFPGWNSTVTQIHGTIAPGQKLAIQVPLAPGRTFTPQVTGFEPDRQMVWLDGFWPMFQGKRTFELVPEVGDKVAFRMTEVFTGLALPMIKGSLPDFRPAFDQYVLDLKRAAEAT